MKKTLRGRLTLLYLFLLSMVLVLYAGWTLFFLWKNLLVRQLDLNLDRDLQAIEHVITPAPEGGVHVGIGDRPGFFLEVWSDSGQLLYQSEENHGQRLGPTPVSTPPLPGHVSLLLADHRRVRVATRVYPVTGKSYIVRLGVSEYYIRGEFLEMVGALAIGLPAALLLVGITGYFVARRALRPLDSMARHAQQINAEHLNERLRIENPEDEPGQLGCAFNETLAKLERSFAQLKRFTADASHELRTPLTALRSVGELAMHSQGDATYYHDVIGSMLEEVNRLTRLVDSLLTLSRADSGSLALQPSPLRLFDLAAESVALLEVLAEEKNQSLEVEGDPSLMVVADRLILRQALVALIHNAVKYSPPQGTVRVRVGAVNGEATVEVRDSGPGIAPEHRTRVFERFYRIDDARTREEGGAGLGLSIAEWAVEAHGGKIELECEPNPGCIFRIKLPRDHP